MENTRICRIDDDITAVTPVRDGLGIWWFQQPSSIVLPPLFGSVKEFSQKGLQGLA